MVDLVQEAHRFQTICEAHGWKFCFIGGLALQTWGEQRLTDDIDLTLLTGFGGEVGFIHTLLEHYHSRISDGVEFALARRVLLLVSAAGIEIDISLGALPLEEEIVARADYKEYLPGLALKVCSPEDLIVLKAFAARGQDWLDIKTVIIRQKRLDWGYILQQLAPLVEIKDAPEILLQLAALRREFS